MTMKRLSRSALLLAISFCCAVPSSARADTTTLDLQPKSKGWLVIAITAAVGIAVTSVAASISCPAPEGESDCSRWASLGIWGGIGILSGGAAIGLAIVDDDVRAARRRQATRAPTSSAPQAPRAALTWTF
jgi:hypothetical protein